MVTSPRSLRTSHNNSNMDYKQLYQLASLHVKNQTDHLITSTHNDEPVVEILQWDMAAVLAHFAFEMMKPKAN